MALTKCPDCKREVSTKAPTCPACGRQMKAGNSVSQGLMRWTLLLIVAVVFGVYVVPRIIVAMNQ